MSPSLKGGLDFFRVVISDGLFQDLLNFITNTLVSKYFFYKGQIFVTSKFLLITMKQNCHCSSQMENAVLILLAVSPLTYLTFSSPSVFIACVLRVFTD